MDKPAFFICHLERNWMLVCLTADIFSRYLQNILLHLLSQLLNREVTDILSCIDILKESFYYPFNMNSQNMFNTDDNTSLNIECICFEI